MYTHIKMPVGQSVGIELPEETIAYGFKQARILDGGDESDKIIETDADSIASAKKAGAAGWGLEKSGQLVLALQKKGEPPREAIARVSDRHPGVKFISLDSCEVLRNFNNFGIDVKDDEEAELVFDYVVQEEEVLFDADDANEALLYRILQAVGR